MNLFIVKLFAAIFLIFMINIANTNANTDLVKFYDVEFIIVDDPPTIYKKIDSRSPGNAPIKLNTSFLYNAVNTSLVNPTRHIIEDQKFIPLAVNYPANYPIRLQDKCSNEFNSNFYLLIYRLHELQVHATIPLVNCALDIEIGKDENDNIDVVWDNDSYTYTFNWVKYTDSSMPATNIDKEEETDDEIQDDNNNQSEENLTKGTLTYDLKLNRFVFELK